MTERQLRARAIRLQNMRSAGQQPKITIEEAMKQVLINLEATE